MILSHRLLIVLTHAADWLSTEKVSVNTEKNKLTTKAGTQSGVWISGFSIDFWHITMHFYAFIKGADSSGEVVEPVKPPHKYAHVQKTSIYQPAHSRSGRSQRSSYQYVFR